MAITNGQHLCHFCNRNYVKIKPWQLYCSYKCGYTANNAKKKRGITNNKLCVRCKKSLAHKKQHAIYCSPTCKSMDHTFKHRSKTRNESTARRALIFDRDKGTCYICFEVLAFDNFHIDHIVPVARGGSNSEGNLAVSCADCNRRKGTTIGIVQLNKLAQLRSADDY